MASQLFGQLVGKKGGGRLGSVASSTRPTPSTKVDVRLPGRGFRIPWREVGPPFYHGDEVDSDQ